MLHFINQTCTQVTEYCPVEDTIYGYAPSLGFNSFFVAFFSLFAIIHATLGLKFRTYFFAYVLTLGSISEALGYGGRIMLWQNPYGSTGFELQISCLIFAPSFIAAGVYINLKHIALTFGRESSMLPPRLYTWVFISCDCVSLTLQAVGGGLAGSAGFDRDQRRLGTILMIAGIVFQVFTMLAFIVLSAILVYRIRRSWDTTVPASAKELAATWRFKCYALGLITATTTVFTRCVYRIPELTGGWGSPIMRDQTSFIILEGLQVLKFSLSPTGLLRYLQYDCNCCIGVCDLPPRLLLSCTGWENEG